MNKIAVKQNQSDTKDITLLSGTKTNTLLFFADDQFTTADPQDNLLRGVFKLKKHSQKFWNGDNQEENLKRWNFMDKDQ